MQVSRSDKTLLEAIRAADVPTPQLMRWNDWQVWRRDFGRRPTAGTDGHFLTQAQESALWKSVMLDLYGADWAVLLLSQGVDEEEEEATLGSEPRLETAAPAGHQQSLRPVDKGGKRTRDDGYASEQI